MGVVMGVRWAWSGEVKPSRKSRELCTPATNSMYVHGKHVLPTFDCSLAFTHVWHTLILQGKVET